MELLQVTEAASVEEACISSGTIKSQYNDLIKKGKLAEQEANKEWYVDALLYYSDACELKRRMEDDENNEKLQKLQRKVHSLQKKCNLFGTEEVVHKRSISETEGFLYDYMNDDYILHNTSGLSSSSSPEEEEEEYNNSNKKMNDSDELFHIESIMFNKLYKYQKQCLKWLWNIHNSNSGGILGDDMGLGKTVQISCFINGLFQSQLIKRVLILCPVSVLSHWMNELKIWCPKVRSCLYNGTKKSCREALYKVKTKGGVLVTSYGRCKSQLLSLSTDLNDENDENDNHFYWDYAILDEGHQIKNPDIQLSKAVRQLPTKHRLILSGTPIQNNLQELWALFDYVSNSCLLGDRKTFKNEFANKIKEGSSSDATLKQQKIANEMAQKLRELIRPYFLRREKKTVKKQQEVEFKTNNHNNHHSNNQQFSTSKTDLILWSYLSKSQLDLYHAFLNSEEVKDTLNTTRSPLATLTVLKKICDHPRLLSDQMKTCKSLQLMNTSYKFDSKSLLLESNKLELLLRLLNMNIRNNHRTLIFSQSKKMLDLIEIVLRTEEYSMLRIDGTVTSPLDRQALVDQYNSDKSIFCFLLTTQTGGLGINLVGADRVVIFDPAWNPAVDNQAVDRCYRVGQTKDIIIYRFISCGTIEEVIYRKQVFKGSLLKITTEACEIKEQLRDKNSNDGDDNDEEEEGNDVTQWSESIKSQQQPKRKQARSPTRYFTKHELQDVFSLRNPNMSQTQNQFKHLHLNNNNNDDDELENEIKYIENDCNDIVYGLHFHHLLFSEKNKNNIHNNIHNSELNIQVQKEVKEGYGKLIQSRTAKKRIISKQSNDISPIHCALLENTTNNNNHQNNNILNLTEQGEEQYVQDNNDNTNDNNINDINNDDDDDEGMMFAPLPRSPKEHHYQQEDNDNDNNVDNFKYLHNNNIREFGTELNISHNINTSNMCNDNNNISSSNCCSTPGKYEPKEEETGEIDAIRNNIDNNRNIIDAIRNNIDNNRNIIGESLYHKCGIHPLRLELEGELVLSLSCRCSLTNEQREQYDMLILKSEKNNNNEDKLNLYLQALDLCDDDIQLHKNCISLGEMLDY